MQLLQKITAVIFVLCLLTVTTSFHSNADSTDDIATSKTISNDVQDAMYTTITYFDPTIKPIYNMITASVESKPDIIPFYASIAELITDDEIETLARLTYLEAGNQSMEGQMAVVEVVFNRMLSEEFPNTVNEVVYAKNQFTPASYISSTTPNQEQYDAVNAVLTETETILDQGVVFFSRKQYNDYLYAKIGDHYFCYSKLYYENQKGQQE